MLYFMETLFAAKYTDDFALLKILKHLEHKLGMFISLRWYLHNT